MKEYLNNIIFKTISQILGERDQQAFVIGGFVRDKLLGRPSKDIDVVTLGSGIELAQEVAQRLLKNPKVATYKNFGTAMFRYRGVDVEFVGARKESYNRNSPSGNGYLCSLWQREEKCRWLPRRPDTFARILQWHI